MNTTPPVPNLHRHVSMQGATPSVPTLHRHVSMQGTTPSPTLHRRVSMQGTTPFSNASQAFRARHPTLAQQLYASATTGQSTLPTPAHSDEELDRDSGYRTNIVLSGSPPEESNLFSTSSNYGHRSNPLPDSSSSLPSPPLSPVWSYPPRRRPRGARTPTFPGPFPVAGPSFTLPPVNETQAASDLRERALFHSLPPTPLTLHNPQNITTFRHSRSASMNSPVAQPFPVGITSKPREIPMHSTFAYPLQISPNPSKTTPAFQNLSPLPAVTSIPAASPIAQFQPGDPCQPTTISPVLGESRDHEDAESARKRKVLTKVGLSVAKSAGKMALRTGTKMALGSMGIPVDTSNMFSSDGDGVLSAITEGISEMAASAATAGVSQALNAATSPSTATTTSPPQSPATISPQPTLSTASQPPMDPASYAAILNQMQAMRLTQHQQNNPSQPVHSPAEYASILSQMQAMQMPHGIQRPPLPSTSFSYQGVQSPSSPVTVSPVNGAQSPMPPQNGSAQGNWQQRPPLPLISFSHQGVQPPSSPVTVSQANGAQSPMAPQNGSAQGNWQQRPTLPSTGFSHQGVQPPSSPVTVSQPNGAQLPRPPQNGSVQGNWQQGLMNSVIGGATHALVSNAVDNTNFSGAADAVTSTFSDFTSSFDPTA